jgi:hypothetical protein
MLAPIQALDYIARHYGRGIELDHGLCDLIRAFDPGATHASLGSLTG